ncbi:MAG: DUF2946 family protein [Burkholderiaceae bacterium]|nr:DUF2946 family protein [Burkholderiaceae bacterium]
MDADVLRAVARWPSVPAVFGWLRLDRRGGWRLVDRGQPDFDEARDGHGSAIENRRITGFIERNYAGDERGRWFWQNGPQRVYVDVEAAPLVLRVFAGAGPGTDARLVTHTGVEVSRMEAAWSGPEGQLLLRTDLGGAVVHDLDLAALPLASAGESVVLRWGGRDLPIGHAGSAEQALGFVARPRADDGSPGSGRRDGGTAD